MSVQRCQEETTSTEFLDWLEYLDWDVNAFHREDWFLAQIAQEIRRTISKDPEKVEVDDFLRKFVAKKVSKKLTRKEIAMQFKQRLLARFKIKTGKK